MNGYHTSLLLPYTHILHNMGEEELKQNGKSISINNLIEIWLEGKNNFADRLNLFNYYLGRIDSLGFPRTTLEFGY